MFDLRLLVCFVFLLLFAVGVLAQAFAQETAPGPPCRQRRPGACPPLAGKRYSRKDIGQLKTFSRAQIFKALGSFDHSGLSDDEFVLKAAALLDPAKVPGLTEALAASDAEAVLAAVCEACKGESVEKPVVSEKELRSADEIMSNKFTFYGETHQLSENIDWDYNPGTAHWGHDLNRFSYLGPLTRACLSTGQMRYGRKAVGLILDYIGKCDFGRAFAGTPYVFGSYLNQAIHCAAWCASVRQLLPEGCVEPIELMRILKSLHDQLAYLEIVTNQHAGNWPTIGFQGMMRTLATFPVLRDHDRFATYCIEGLAEQVDEQVLPDGVQDELTPHYHSCVIGNILTVASTAREIGLDLEPRTLEALRKMVHYLQQITTPDGSALVAFNDGDPESVPDFSAPLKALGLEGYLSPPEALGPELFPYAGVALLRQQQTEGDLYLALDAGPYGRAHQHEDKLGFWLFAYGHNFIVDPGRHLYDWSEKSYRRHLKSTRAHSTILVDGKGQHSEGRRDTWIAKEPMRVAWSMKEGEIRASAAYDLGYGGDNALDIVHRREIVFVKERFWVVFDLIDGEGKHYIQTRFQFAPGDLRIKDGCAATCFDDANLLLWRYGRWAFQRISRMDARTRRAGGTRRGTIRSC
ncbi:MAG: hypothetical protein AMS15_06600, partial [Planctomycetes bacterium DG_23]